MPIALQCTCGRALKLRDQLAGKLVQCPSCAVSLRVPSPDDEVEILDTPPPPPPSHRAPMRITEFVEEHNPIRPAVSAGNLPPQIKTPSTPPPLPGAPQPKSQLLPAEEEEIPEFGHLEVLEDTQALLPAEPTAAMLQMAYEENLDRSSMPNEAGASIEFDDDGDDWEDARLQEISGVALSEDTARTAAQAEDEPGAYRLAADAGTGLNLNSIGPLSDVCLDTESVTCLAYGADHKTHLAAGCDEMFLLDFTEHDYTRLPRMHGATIRRMAISSDCRMALSGDEGGGLMLWDLHNQRPLRWLDGHRSGITAVAFSADGTYAASGGIGGAVWLWRMPAGEMLSLHQGQMDDAINCLAFSPDGRMLAAIGSKGRARLWRVADRMPTVRLDSGAAHLRSVAFSKDNASLLAGSDRRMKICKWDVPSGNRQPSFLGLAKKQSRVRRTWLCAEANCLLALRFWLNPPQKIQHDGIAPPLPWSYGVARVALQATTQIVKDTVDEFKSSQPVFHLELWDVAYERVLGDVSVGPRPPEAVASSADGHRALVAFEDASVVLFGL